MQQIKLKNTRLSTTSESDPLGMTGEGDRQRIVQETEIWPNEQMIYAPNLSLRMRRTKLSGILRYKLITKS